MQEPKIRCVRSHVWSIYLRQTHPKQQPNLTTKPTQLDNQIYSTQPNLTTKSALVPRHLDGHVRFDQVRFGDQVYVYVDARCEDIADVVEAYLDAPRLEAAAAAKTIEEAEYAAAEPCPAGRTQITGEILSTKLQQDFYGSTLKMLLKDDRGFKVWGSVAASLEQPQRGDRVTFMATITPSDDDTKFGFFKRPTKAVYLNEAAA